MSYINTQLAEHQDDEASFTHWNKINDQPIEELRFQTRILDRMRGSEHELFAAFGIRRSEKTKDVPSINQERERDSCSSDAIKILTLNQPTTDSSVVFIMCCIQTNRPFPFSLGSYFCHLEISWVSSAVLFSYWLYSSVARILCRPTILLSRKHTNLDGQIVLAWITVPAQNQLYRHVIRTLLKRFKNGAMRTVSILPGLHPVCLH